MKKLDMSPIAAGISMYMKGGTLSFLQLAYQEALNELTKSRIGSFYDPTKGYILNGCLNTGTGSTYTISTGSVFFNGEVFLVPAASFTLTGSNVAEGVITTTQYTTDADPTDFTDGVQRNVHNIRQIVFQNGLAGSAAFDFVNAINLGYRPQGAIGQTVEWLMPGSGSQNSQLATYFDPGTLQGIHPLTYGWIIDDGGMMAIGYKSGDATAATIGNTGGEDQHTLVINEIPVISPINGSGIEKGGGGVGTGGLSATDAPTGSYAPGELIEPFGGGQPHNNLSRYKIKLKITRFA